MAPTMWSKTSVIVAAVVTACALLAGCASAPPFSGSGGTAPGSEATPEQTDNAQTDNAQTEGDAGPASCLIGTWKQDLEAFTKAAFEESVKLGSSSGGNLEWGGGSFLRFDHEDTFFVWMEDSTFEWSAGDFHRLSVTNGNAAGDYLVDGGLIQWSNYSVLNSNSVTYEGGVFVDETSFGDLGDFSIPGAFTCATDKLEMYVGDDRLTMPRVYDRIADATPNN